MGNFSSALQFDQRALDIRVKLFGEEHPNTAECYVSLGVTQYASGDFLSALQSHQHALDIRIKLFWKEHPHTAECYFSLGETQHALGNFSSALQSKQRALDIRVKLFGEEHTHTADKSAESLKSPRRTKLISARCFYIFLQPNIILEEIKRSF